MLDKHKMFNIFCWIIMTGQSRAKAKHGPSGDLHEISDEGEKILRNTLQKTVLSHSFSHGILTISLGGSCLGIMFPY